MIKEIKNTFKFFIEINIKWWSIALTTILSFLDSLSNVLLLLGIGQIVSNQIGSHSTKGNILKLLFGSLSSSNHFLALFLSFLCLKVISIALKTYFTEQIKAQITTHCISRWLKTLPSHSFDLKTNEINNLVTKGFIAFVSDSFFLLVVFTILCNYSLSIGLLFMTFIALNIFAIKFFYGLNHKTISDTQTLKSRFKRKYKLINQFSNELHRINRLEKEKNILNKRLSAYETKSSKQSLLIALTEAITPVSFFSFLLFIAYSHSFFTNELAASFLEITLLLIYSQGSLRRNMRATRYWLLGRVEIEKFLQRLSSAVMKEVPIEGKIRSIKSSQRITELQDEQLIEFQTLYKNPESLAPNLRYFKQRFHFHGESLLSALIFTNQKKEKATVLQLANKLDTTGELEKIINEQKSNFLPKLSHEHLFFCLIILCEIDNSELIYFDSSYRTYFETLFNKPNVFLKKIYLCE